MAHVAEALRRRVHALIALAGQVRPLILVNVLAPVGQWLTSALRKTFARDPIRIRMMGGTVPTGAAVQALKIPFVILPLVNADNNQHSFDENMRLGNYFDGVHSLVHLLAEPF